MVPKGNLSPQDKTAAAIFLHEFRGGQLLAKTHQFPVYLGSQRIAGSLYQTDGSRHIAQFFGEVIGFHIDADTHHDTFSNATFKIPHSLGKDSADLFPMEKNIIDPFNFRRLASHPFHGAADSHRRGNSNLKLSSTGRQG